MDYDAVIKTLTAWADAEPTIRALVMVGSATAGTAHPLSDRDIEIYTTDPDALLQDDSWWNQLGEVLVVERLPNPGSFPTRLIYYAGGKLDFRIAPADALAAKVTDQPFTVLLDKDDQGSRATRTALVGHLPDAEDFDRVLNWAYAAALMCAKAIVRDELWSAKNRDHDLKEHLLQMIEWDHRARYGTAFDTHRRGARFRLWMDRDVQRDLMSCWASLDPEASAAALTATVELLARLATRTAENRGFRAFDHRRLRTELDEILAFRVPA